jgi:hypothetical protein
METLRQAMQWAKDKYADAPIQHKAAFANSVAYLVTGASGGFGGPSVREHLVSWSLAGKSGKVEALNVGGEALTAMYPDGSMPMAGQWEFDAAVAYCASICFGDITVHRQQALQILEREHCFDDLPADLEALRGKSA